MWKLIGKATKQFAEISIGQFIILTIVGVLIVTIIEMIRLFALHKEIELYNVFITFCLVIYVNIILQLTLLGRKDGSRIGFELQPFQYFFSSGSTYKKMALIYSFLNILLFVPYGFLYSFGKWMQKKFRIQLLLSFLIALGSSLVIEMLQLITQRGYYEVEDLICNTLGGLIGTLCWYIIVIVKRRRIHEDE